MCMDNNSCIHVYISIFIYDSILYIFLKIPMYFIDNSNPAHHRYILTFNSIMICNLFLRQLRNISLIIYSIFTFLFNPSIHIISELLMHTPLRNEFTNQSTAFVDSFFFFVFNLQFPVKTLFPKLFRWVPLFLTFFTWLCQSLVTELESFVIVCISFQVPLHNLVNSLKFSYSKLHSR